MSGVKAPWKANLPRGSLQRWHDVMRPPTSSTPHRALKKRKSKHTHGQLPVPSSRSRKSVLRPGEGVAGPGGHQVWRPSDEDQTGDEQASLVRQTGDERTAPFCQTSTVCFFLEYLEGPSAAPALNWIQISNTTLQPSALSNRRDLPFQPPLSNIDDIISLTFQPS